VWAMHLPGSYAAAGERRGLKTTRAPTVDTNTVNGGSSPRMSVLMRCGDGESGEGKARLGGGGPRFSALPVLEVEVQVKVKVEVEVQVEVEATAGEAEAEEEQVGRFWKYCSPGSSSSKLPHGYAC